MKKMKNAMLVIAGSLFMLAVATVSCKKDSTSSTPSGPVITNGGIPSSITVGSTITITGSGFSSPATVNFPGAANTAVASVTATTITVVVPAGATLGSGTITVTSGGQTSAGVTVTIVAATYTGPTSDSVASTFLIAHWTFDASSAETKSGVTAFTGGAYNVGTVTYSNPGVLGNCATFTNGALVFPSITNLNLDTALQSYTISMWVKMPTQDGKHWKSLFQLNSNAYTGLFGIVGVQALNQRSGDTLALQIDQTQIDGTGSHTAGFGCGGCFNNPSYPGINLTNPLNYATDTTKWTLLTTTYNGNGTNEKMIVYANGVALDSLTLTNVTKPQTFRIVPTGGTGAGAPTSWADYVTIGTFNYSDFPVFAGTDGYGDSFTSASSVSGYMSNGITGSIDDIRVFNTYLSASQVAQLYTLGSAGH
jgi:hypothetical protein